MCGPILRDMFLGLCLNVRDLEIVWHVSGIEEGTPLACLIVSGFGIVLDSFAWKASGIGSCMQSLLPCRVAGRKLRNQWRSDLHTHAGSTNDLQAPKDSAHGKHSEPVPNEARERERDIHLYVSHSDGRKAG